MSAAQKVERVLRDHQLVRADLYGWTCKCGYKGPGEAGDPDRHRAAEIAKALGEPTVEYGVRWGVDGWDDERCDDRAHAESLIDRWPNGGGVLVTRTVLTGEWQEAE